MRTTNNADSVKILSYNIIDMVVVMVVALV